ncbi:hypothetical protein [Vibrio sp. YIC-376]
MKSGTLFIWSVMMTLKGISTLLCEHQVVIRFGLSFIATRV